MSSKAETIAGEFSQKVGPERGQTRFLRYKPEAHTGTYSSSPAGHTRTTQYPTYAGSWDQDEAVEMA